MSCTLVCVCDVARTYVSIWKLDLPFGKFHWQEKNKDKSLVCGKVLTRMMHEYVIRVTGEGIVTG